jgi:hypothetical protein
MNKKRKKIEQARKLAKPLKPLTPEETKFVEEHMKKGGNIVIRNPSPEQYKVIEDIEKKGIQVIVIIRKIIDK